MKVAADAVAPAQLGDAALLAQVLVDEPLPLVHGRLSFQGKVTSLPEVSPMSLDKNVTGRPISLCEAIRRERLDNRAVAC